MINVRDDRKIVEIWLTRAEKDDLYLKQELQTVYSKYRQRKYMVAVFESGNCNIYQSTRDLLVYNKRQSAQKALQLANKPKRSTMER